MTRFWWIMDIKICSLENRLSSVTQGINVKDNKKLGFGTTSEFEIPVGEAGWWWWGATWSFKKTIKIYIIFITALQKCTHRNDTMRWVLFTGFLRAQLCKELYYSSQCFLIREQQSLVAKTLQVCLLLTPTNHQQISSPSFQLT